MNTLEELIYYCKEPEPVGALLLNGEWGCGKTYLIDNKFTESIKNDAYVVRVSLFGISSMEEIHLAVRQAWMETYCKDKGISNVTEKIQKGKELLSELNFLPEWVTGVASTNWTSLVEIKNKIGDKLVVLVFDDLERCCINNVDVLGAINDYCENQKFHTIIVANQEKMYITDEKMQLDAEIEISEDQQNRSRNSLNKKAVLKVNVPSKRNDVELSYPEIKEKIIQRTVQYVPNYAEIVHTVIEDIKYESEECKYKNFIKENETGILELFAPQEDDCANGLKRPHNIRSLKCAINDFYRVYKIMTEKEISNIDKWFLSFAAYVISYKADIAKEGRYGTLISDDNVRKLYPAFQNDYMLSGVKKWILHGEWDEDVIKSEIANIKEREKAVDSADVVRTYRIMDIEENVIEEGFPKVLDMAYKGELCLDNYVLLIENSCWANYYGFSFPVSIEWEKVRQGIAICIEKLVEERVEGQQLHKIISVENREIFSDEEWKTYQIIELFRTGNTLMYSNNKKLYIDGLKNDALSAFYTCQNKRYKEFDEEMAIATAEAYYSGDNATKRMFVNCFNEMWRSNIISPELDKEQTLLGLNKLLELLQEQKKEFEEKGKLFAVCHTDNFIKNINGITESLNDVPI